MEDVLKESNGMKKWKMYWKKDVIKNWKMLMKEMQCRNER